MLGCAGPAGEGESDNGQPLAQLVPWEGEVCRLLVVGCLFVLNLRNFVSAWVLGLFVTWRAGGSVENCCEHLEPVDLSLPKPPNLV